MYKLNFQNVVTSTALCERFAGEEASKTSLSVKLATHEPHMRAAHPILATNEPL